MNDRLGAEMQRLWCIAILHVLHRRHAHVQATENAVAIRLARGSSPRQVLDEFAAATGVEATATVEAVAMRVEATETRIEPTATRVENTATSVETTRQPSLGVVTRLLAGIRHIWDRWTKY